MNVVHVMLHRGALPLQLRIKPMWSYEPEHEVIVRHFFRTNLAGMWTSLFKRGQNPPPQLVALLAEEPYEVPVKEPKKKKDDLRSRRMTSEARSENNHDSSIDEEEE